MGMAAIHFTLPDKLYEQFQEAMKKRKCREIGVSDELERGDKKRYTSEAIRQWVEEEKAAERRIMDRYAWS